tara:strand:+ start:3145 stop:4038 length:894 start_codon:yes stop_codon:yes gene_type:complete
MRILTNKLNTVFGAQYSRDINVFVSEVFSTVSLSDGVEIKADLIPEDDLASKIIDCVNELKLAPEQALKCMMVAPITKQGYSIVPMVEFKTELFESLLKPVASVRVTLIWDGDEVINRGNSKIIEHSKSGGDDIVGGFINGETTEGQPFSVIVQGEEWKASVAATVNKKYNNVDVMDNEWWQECLKAILFRRLIDEFVGSMLADVSPENYCQYRNIISYSDEYFKEVTESDSLILNNYGKVIGKATQLFTVQEHVEATVGAKSKGQHLRVIVNNDNKLESSVSGIDESEGNSEWGTF